MDVLVGWPADDHGVGDIRTCRAELGLGRPERAARLLGAADRALHTLEVALDPCGLPDHQRVVTGLLRALGAQTLDRARAQGAQVSLKEAVALALTDHDGVTRRDVARQR